METAHAWWTTAGRPGHDRLGLTVDRDGTHTLWVDDPARAANTQTMQRVLLDAVGLYDAPTRYDDLIIPERVRAAADARLTAVFPSGRPGRLVALNIGSSRKGLLKRWPPASWAALADRLTTAGVAVVVLAGPDEATDATPSVSALLPPRVPVLTGATIGEYLATIRRLDLVVTADTLGLHAAAAQHVPVVALVGPMPHRELELDPADRVVGPTLPCSPCYLHCTRSVAGECMTLISVDAAAIQTLAALIGQRTHRPPAVTSRGQRRTGPGRRRTG